MRTTVRISGKRKTAHQNLNQKLKLKRKKDAKRKDSYFIKTKIATTSSTQKNQAKLETFQTRKQHIK